jgi:hypothetical protein
MLDKTYYLYYFILYLLEIIVIMYYLKIANQNGRLNYTEGLT